MRDVIKSITSLFRVSTRACTRCERGRGDPSCPDCAGSGLVFDVADRR